MTLRRGLSLVEVVLAVSLLGLVVSLAVLHLHGAPSRASVRSAAEVLAEEFRYARNRAAAHGVPVAVALPGGSPVTRAIYHLEGWVRPQVVRVRRLDGDFPTAWLFCGYWRSSTPGAGALVNRRGFSLTDWAVSPADRVYAFLPSGAVVSDQPTFDGAFHVVVCDGLKASPGEVGGRSFHRLDAVSTAATVRVSLTGD
ncbi:MAG: hypothetical protein AB1758_19675, partial [Candidatus Eremiobacterota bacterium]